MLKQNNLKKGRTGHQALLRSARTCHQGNYSWELDLCEIISVKINLTFATNENNSLLRLSFPWFTEQWLVFWWLPGNKEDVRVRASAGRGAPRGKQEPEGWPDTQQ